MKGKNILIVVFAILLIAACEQTNDPAGGDATFVPSFQNTWKVEGDSNHTIFLDSDDVGLNSGIFYGLENDPDNNIADADLCGRFDNAAVEFNIRRPLGTVKYKGSFINKDRIEANSPSGQLVLVRPTF